MKLANFPEQNTVVARDQSRYIPIPAYHNRQEGSLTMCIKLSDDELNRVKATGEVWLKVLTFNKPMQPIAPSTNKEDLLPLRLWKEIKTDKDFNDVASDMLNNYLTDFPRVAGLTRKPEEADFLAFGHREITLMYTPKGMQLYDRARKRLIKLGIIKFPDGNIQVAASGMLTP